MPRLDMIDVSHYQTDPPKPPIFDWKMCVSMFGITGGACKVSQGTSFTDPTWKQNRQGMLEAGLRTRGLYHWLTDANPDAQAMYFFNRVGTLMDGEYVMIDIEDRTMNLTQAKILDALDSFSIIYPGRVARYQGKHFPLRNTGDDPVYTPWPWFLPNYNSFLPPSRLPVVVWQWGGAAIGQQVPGYGRVDSSQIMDSAALDRLANVVPPSSGGPQMWGQFVQDDREVGWDIWFEGVDIYGNFWTDTVNNLGWDWNVIENVSSSPRPLAALEAARKKQNRPATPPSFSPIDVHEIALAVVTEFHARLAE